MPIEERFPPKAPHRFLVLGAKRTKASKMAGGGWVSRAQGSSGWLLAGGAGQGHAAGTTQTLLRLRTCGGAALRCICSLTASKQLVHKLCDKAAAC